MGDAKKKEKLISKREKETNKKSRNKEEMVSKYKQTKT